MTDAWTPLAEWGFPNAATPPGSSTYYAIRFAPRAQRDTLALLCAWRKVLRDCLSHQDSGLARLKLAWWCRELQQAQAGTAQHPLIRLLGERLDWAISLEPLIDMAERVEARILGEIPPHREALRNHWEQDLGALFALWAQVGGANDPVAHRAAGGFVGLVETLQQAGWDCRQQRPLLPSQDWQVLGLTAGALLAAGQRGGLHTLMTTLAEAARQERRVLPATLTRPVAIRVQLATDLLDELSQADFPVFHQYLSLTPLRKLWRAWRTD
ncbi:Squalene/phytoene synthase family protein [Gammaproteobacteria bacterium]